MDSGSEGSGVFGVARSNTAPPFEKKESVLHEMAEFVEIFVVFPQMFSVLGRLLQLHFPRLGHHGRSFLTGCFLLSWAWIALSILATSFALERGTTENTLR